MLVHATKQGTEGWHISNKWQRKWV